MTYFILWNIKEDILRNDTFFVRVNGQQNGLVMNILQKKKFGITWVNDLKEYFTQTWKFCH